MVKQNVMSLADAVDIGLDRLRGTLPDPSSIPESAPSKIGQPNKQLSIIIEQPARLSQVESDEVVTSCGPSTTSSVNCAGGRMSTDRLRDRSSPEWLISGEGARRSSSDNNAMDELPSAILLMGTENLSNHNGQEGGPMATLLLREELGILHARPNPILSTTPRPSIELQSDIPPPHCPVITPASDPAAEGGSDHIEQP
jgi:hypothetical protein